MPSIGELFRTERIEWRDRVLTVARASFAAEAAYRHHLESEARAAVNRHRGNMDAVEYKTQLAAWQEACAAKVYDYGGECWARSMASRENAVRWFWLIFTQDGPDGKPSPNQGLTLGEMEQVWKDKADKINEAWERLNAPERPEADPTAPPAAAAAQAPAA